MIFLEQYNATKINFIVSCYPCFKQMALYEEKQRSIIRDVSSLGLDSDISDAKAKLEVLRKGCCHPQVWDKDLARKKKHGHGQGYGQGQGQGQRNHVARPFGEIMVLKVEQSRLMCEEKQRELVFYLNSLAGVAVLQAQLISAGCNFSDEMDEEEEAVDMIGSNIRNGFDSPDSNSVRISSSTGRDRQPYRSTAADFLRRALIAFASAYSQLERNRRTCPVVGLVRVIGTPENAFSVLKAHGEDEGGVEEGEENLTDRELCADKLSFSWSGQDYVGHGSRVLSEIEVEDSEGAGSQTASNLVITLGDSNGHTPSMHLPPPVAASRCFYSPHSASLHTGSLVCAKMAFGVGRRLQQLRVQTGLISVVSRMRDRFVKGGGKVVERSVMVFPREVSVLAATGIADAFTRVTCCNLQLPTLSMMTSEGNNNADYCPPTGLNMSAASFQISDSATLSAELMKDFPLSFRARSWRVDINTVHGWCLEVQVANEVDALPSTSSGVGTDGIKTDLQSLSPKMRVMGRWIQLSDILHPTDSSESTGITAAQLTTTKIAVAVAVAGIGAGAGAGATPASAGGEWYESSVPPVICMRMDVEIFEATFDVDPFQVLIYLF